MRGRILALIILLKIKTICLVGGATSSSPGCPADSDDQSMVDFNNQLKVMLTEADLLINWELVTVLPDVETIFVLLKEGSNTYSETTIPRADNGTKVALSDWDDKLLFVRVALDDCSFMNFYVPTSETVLPNNSGDKCGPNIFDLVFTAKSEQQWSYTDDVTATSYGTGSLNPMEDIYFDNIKSPHYHLTNYTKYCFGMLENKGDKSGVDIGKPEDAKWILITPNKVATLHDLFDSDTHVDVDATAADILDFKSINLDRPNHKGFKFKAPTKSTSYVGLKVMFGVSVQDGGRHTEYIAVGMEKSSLDGSTSIGYLRQGENKLESIDYKGFFLGLRKPENFIESYEKEKCGEFDKGDCGNGIILNYCKLTTYSENFCGAPPPCTKACVLQAPVLSVQNITSTTALLSWQAGLAHASFDYEIVLSSSKSLSGNILTSDILQYELSGLDAFTDYSANLTYDGTLRNDLVFPSTVTFITAGGKPSTAPSIASKYAINASCIRVTIVPYVESDLNGVFVTFQLHYSLTSGRTGTILDVNLNETVCNLLSSTEYHISVRVKNNAIPPDCFSDWSQITQVTTGEDVPTEPELLSTSPPSMHSIVVEWLNLKSSVAYYSVYHKKIGESEYAVNKTTEIYYEANGLQHSTNYSFRVSATNRIGEGGLSNELVISTDFGPPTKGPNISSILNVGVGEVSINISLLPQKFWRELTGYTIVVNNTETVNFTGLNTEVTGLKPFTIYEFSVRAFNTKYGYGPLGEAFIHRTSEAAPSDSPQKVALGKVSYGSVDLTYEQVSWMSRHGIITSYQITCIGGGKSHVITEEGLKGHVRELKAETEYECQVAACNVAGCGPSSNATHVKTIAAIPQDPPVIEETGYINSTSIFVRWSHIDEDKWGRPEDKQYCVLMEDISYTVCTGNDTLELNITGLQGYTAYNVSLYCKNVIGEGPTSTPKLVLTDQLPPEEPPRNLRFGNASTNKILFSWDMMAPSAYKGILEGYTIHVSAMVTEEQVTVAKKDLRKRRSIIDVSDIYNGSLVLQETITVPDPNQNSVAVENLFGNTMYNVTIATNTKYSGVFSQGNLTTTAKGVPLISAVNLECCDKSEDSFTACWDKTPSLFLQGALLGYTTWIRMQGDLEWTSDSLDQSQTSYKQFGLIALTVYELKISAYTASGLGANYTLFCETGEAEPSRAPENFTAESMEYPTGSTLRWLPLPKKFWKGKLLGYKVSYQRLTRPGGKTDMQNEWKIIDTKSLNTTFVLHGLTPYSSYAVKVAGYTAKGLGPYTDNLNFDTCRIYRPNITIEYIHFKPFVLPSHENRHGGIMIGATERAVQGCSAYCTSFAHPIQVVYRHVSNITKMNDFMEYKTRNIKLPTIETNKVSTSSKFTITVSTPGSILLQTAMSDEDIIETNELIFFDGIVEAMEFLGVYFLINCLCGCFLYILEACHQKISLEDGHCLSFRGIFEGMYLAIATSTTVGYGDKIPETGRGRVFMVVWTLIGLVLTGIAVGNLTSALSYTIISSIQDVFPKDEVLAMSGSPEYVWASGNMKLSNVSLLDHTEVLNALKNKVAKKAIIEQYVLEAHKDFIIENGFKILQDYPSDESVFGVTLGSDYMHLTDCVAQLSNEYSQMVEKDVEKMKEKLASQRKSSASQNIEDIADGDTVQLVSFDAPIYQTTLTVLIVCWVFLMIAGSVYEIVRLSRAKKENMKVASQLDKHLAFHLELRNFLGEYRTSFDAMQKRLIAKTDAILYRHGEELLRLTKHYSKMYGVNFKYVAIKDLGVSLESIQQYKEETLSGPKEATLKIFSRYLVRKFAQVRIWLGL